METIEEYKLRHNIKELPIMFYFQGMFFWILPVAIIVGLIIRIFNYPHWAGMIVIIPWCIWWGLKSFNKYRSDKGVYHGKKL